MADTFNSASLGYVLSGVTQSSPYVALLFQDPQRVAESFLVDGGGWLTLTATTPSIKTAQGKRVSLITSTVLPGGQSQYFMVKHPSNAAKFKLALTLSDAENSITVSVPGSATGTAFDETINANDSIQSLVSYELSFDGYTRTYSSFDSAVLTVPPATPKASRQGSQSQFTNNGSTAPECTHVLVLFGGSTTSGDTYADFYGLTVNTGITTVPANGVYNVNVAIEAVNG